MKNGEKRKNRKKGKNREKNGEKIKRGRKREGGATGTLPRSNFPFNAHLLIYDTFYLLNTLTGTLFVNSGW